VIGVVLDERGSNAARTRLSALFARAGRPLHQSIECCRAALGIDDSVMCSLVQDTPRGAAAWRGRMDESDVDRFPLLPIKLREACALILASRDGVLLARGPFGGEPLYYAVEGRGSRFVACSRLAPLVSILEERPALRVERLGALLVSGTGSDSAATHFTPIFRVRPCEQIRFEDGAIRSSREPPRAPETRVRNTVEDLAFELREELFAAVDRAAARFTSVAVATGGGLDSSGIFVALELRKRRVPGFEVHVVAIDFGGKGDDRPHLRALAKEYQVEPIRVRPREAASLVPDQLVADASPVTWPGCAIGIVMAERALAQGAQVLFTGNVGDYVLDGDLRTFAARARDGHLLRAVSDAARLQVPWTSSRRRRVRSLVLQPLLREWLPESWRARWRLRNLRRSSMWRWAGPRLKEVLEDLERPREPPLDWFSSFAMMDDLMEAADDRGHDETVHGLPHLDPYSDAAFVEFIASIPPDVMFHGHRTKGLYRHSMRGFLPESLRLRPDKADFEPVMPEILAAMGGSHRLGRWLKAEALADLGLVDPVEYAKAFALTEGGHRPPNGWLGVWPAVAMEAFVSGYQ
jgi:asparagine synthase (glutamine-hydrolysing)